MAQQCVPRMHGFHGRCHRHEKERYFSLYSIYFHAQYLHHHHCLLTACLPPRRPIIISLESSRCRWHITYASQVSLKHAFIFDISPTTTSLAIHYLFSPRAPHDIMISKRIMGASLDYVYVVRICENIWSSKYRVEYNRYMIFPGHRRLFISHL